MTRIVQQDDVYYTVRQWYHQTCTEYGYYQTTNSNKSIFGKLFPLNYFINLCTDLYGD